MFHTKTDRHRGGLIWLALAASVTAHVLALVVISSLHLPVPTDRAIGGPGVASSIDVVVTEVEELG